MRSMPAFGYVEYDDASPEVKAVYDDIMATRNVDWISNFWKSMAHDPALLRRTWSTLKEVMRPDGALDPLTKELLYLAVSASNQCHYCIASHTAAAWKAGMTDAMFGEVMSIVGMANETNRLVSGYQVEVDDRFKVRDEGWKKYKAPREVAESYLRAVEQNDRATLDAIVDPDFVGFDGDERANKETLLKFTAAVESGVTGMKFHIESVKASGEWITVINTASGKHTGVFMGLPPTDKTFCVRGMAVIRVVKGKVVEVHSHWDVGSFLRQIGGAAPMRVPA
jgi:AhpD family alkylhydroperoxidase